MSTLRDGELVHFTVHVPNLEQGRMFYSALLGWELDEGEDPLASNLKLAGGIAEGAEPMNLYFWAGEIERVAQRVRDAGGRCEQIATGHSGKWAMCHDNQGTQFSLSWLVPEFRPPGGGAAVCSGELGYWVIPVPDVATGKEFYRHVFSWEFAPGEHYAHILNTTTAGGLAKLEGDSPKGWFVVDDIEAALVKVEQLGGTAGETSASDSGLSADCRDDQGMALSLWQPAQDIK